MEERRRGPRLQIRLGGLVVLVIVALVLFKVDLKEKIQSEKFQQNIEYVKGYVSDFWEKITRPIREKIGDKVEEYTEDQLGKIQEGIKKGVLNLIDKEEGEEEEVKKKTKIENRETEDREDGEKDDKTKAESKEGGEKDNQEKEGDNTEEDDEESGGNMEEDISFEKAIEDFIKDSFQRQSKLSEYLLTCSPYEDSFPTPFSSIFIKKEIKGIVENKCIYQDEIIGQYKIKCELAEDQRVNLAKFFNKISLSDSIDSSYRVSLLSGDSTSKIVVDGEEVVDYYNQFLQDGTCSVFFYDDEPEDIYYDFTF